MEKLVQPLNWNNFPSKEMYKHGADLMTFSQPLTFKDFPILQFWAWEYQKFWINYLN